MLELEIEGTTYTAPDGWHEVTLGQFIRACNVEIPAKLRALWVASAGDDEEELKQAEEAIGVQELEKDFPRYYGRLMELFTTIPTEVIDRMHGPLREQFFNVHLRYIIYSSFARYPVVIRGGKTEMYDPPEREYFEFEGTQYMFPETLRVYGEEIPLGKEQAITFAEASDIEVALRNMAEGAANRLPMFVAVYCRPKGEVYDEEVTMERAKLFERGLTMDNVWRVFFCIYKRLGKYQNFIQEYSRKLEPELVQKLGSLV